MKILYDGQIYGCQSECGINRYFRHDERVMTISGNNLQLLLFQVQSLLGLSNVATSMEVVEVEPGKVERIS